MWIYMTDLCKVGLQLMDFYFFYIYLELYLLKNFFKRNTDLDTAEIKFSNILI